jgi:hypothetical protein
MWDRGDYQEWSSEDFSETRGVKDLSKMKSQSKQPGLQHLLNVLPTKAPDYPYSVSLSGSGTRSLVSGAQCLCLSTAGLSRDGFTLKGEIGSIRS